MIRKQVCSDKLGLFVFINQGKYIYVKIFHCVENPFRLFHLRFRHFPEFFGGFSGDGHAYGCALPRPQRSRCKRRALKLSFQYSLFFAFRPPAQIFQRY